MDELLTWMVIANNIKIAYNDTDVYWAVHAILSFHERNKKVDAKI